MTIMFLLVLAFVIGWIVGSGNWKSIWAWAVATAAAIGSYAEPWLDWLDAL